VSRRVSATLAAVAIACFLGCWALVHLGTFGRSEISDTAVYEQYRTDVASGQIPYRDFQVEYPPAALPVFMLPSSGKRGATDPYPHRFDRLMALCGCLALLGTALCLRRLGADLPRSAAALGLAAVSPVLLGPEVFSRFDFWPTALTVLALAAVLWDRLTWSFVLLGTAIAAKLWPLALAPLAFVYVWRTRGPRTARRWATGLLAVDAVWFLPFAVLSPGGIAHVFANEFRRPLQIESLGGALLIAVHHVTGSTLHTVSSFGSQNLSGPAVGAVEFATGVLSALALVGVWAAFVRGSTSPQRLATYAAAASAVVIAFGKVFSPQYLIWLIPLVPLVRGRRGIAASALFAASLVLTQTWFPRHYWELALDFDATRSWLLLARDLVVVALAGVLAWPRLEHELLGEHRARVEALQRVRTQVQ
jgi:hypothetical protein